MNKDLSLLPCFSFFFQFLSSSSGFSSRLSLPLLPLLLPLPPPLLFFFLSPLLSFISPFSYSLHCFPLTPLRPLSTNSFHGADPSLLPLLAPPPNLANYHWIFTTSGFNDRHRPIPTPCRSPRPTPPPPSLPIRAPSTPIFADNHGHRTAILTSTKPISTPPIPPSEPHLTTTRLTPHSPVLPSSFHGPVCNPSDPSSMAPPSSNPENFTSIRPPPSSTSGTHAHAVLLHACAMPQPLPRCQQPPLRSNHPLFPTSGRPSRITTINRPHHPPHAQPQDPATPPSCPIRPPMPPASPPCSPSPFVMLMTTIRAPSLLSA